MAGRYKAYPEYKESGVEWFGYIPRSWSLSRLKFSSLINMGQSPSSDDCNIDGIGLAFLQGNAEFGSKYPTEKQFCPTSKKIAKAGELLFSVRAPVGALNIADKNYGIGRGLCSIRGNSDVEQGFLWWVLPAYKKQFDAVSTGSTFEAVSAEQVGNLAFGLPSNIEQKKIASFLDHETAKIDTLIAKQEKLIELLKEKRQAVISHAVTKGLNPQVPMRDSGVEWLGEVPEHWGVGALKHIVKQAKNSMVDGPFGSSVNTDEDYVDSGIPVIRTVNITNNGFVFENLMFMREAKFQELQRHSVHPNDVLFSKVGTIGNACLLPEEVPEAILSTTGSCKITVEDTQYLPQFLVWVIQSMNQQLMLIANSNVQPFLNMSNIKNLIIPMPNVQEQAKIIGATTSKVEKIDNAISKSDQLSRSLKERKTALISAVVTGKIDVRDFVSEQGQPQGVQG